MTDDVELQPGENKKEQKRRQILIAALNEFSEKGYGQAVLDDVASKAGVAKGTLYLYYRDKKDLFGQTILFVVDNLIELIDGIRRSNLSPIEKIESLIRDEVYYFLDNKNLFNLFQMAFQENLILPNKDLLNKLIVRKNQIVKFLREIINEAKDSGIVKPNFPTDDIITVIDGIVASILKNYRANEMGIGLNEDRRSKKDFITEKLSNSIRIIFEGLINKNSDTG